MKLTIGFSPCPNDTFIFDALIHNKIDTEGIEFDLFLGDVEELNKKAENNQLNITKLSYHAFAYLTHFYNLLDSGSALGNNCGPLLISKKTQPPHALQNAVIAIPGERTTANFLLNFYLPTARKKEAYLFSEIEEAVLTEEVDAGVIIHENRFTYQQKGLKLIQDLGDYWEKKTNYPIPLGGIVIQNSLDLEVQRKVNRLIKRSVNYAFKNNSQLPPFITKNAQEMSEKVMRQHIDLYVNGYSVSLEKKGRKAVQFMLKQIEKENHVSIIQ